MGKCAYYEVTLMGVKTIHKVQNVLGLRKKSGYIIYLVRVASTRGPEMGRTCSRSVFSISSLGLLGFEVRFWQWFQPNFPKHCSNFGHFWLVKEVRKVQSSIFQSLENLSSTQSQWRLKFGFDKKFEVRALLAGQGGSESSIIFRSLEYYLSSTQH